MCLTIAFRPIALADWQGQAIQHYIVDLYPGLQVSPPVHENQLSKSNKLDAKAIWPWAKWG
jgi:hypothetical protein